MGGKEGAGERPLLVHFESNVEAWGIWDLGASKSVLKRTMTDEEGNRFSQELEISPGNYGRPRVFDYRVYTAVVELLEIRGGMPENGVLRFHVQELMEIMGLEKGGHTYELIRESLLRVALTGFVSKNAFWSKGRRRYVTETIKLWDVHFDEVEREGEMRGRHRIEFGKLFVRSFKERYVRGLDTDLFWALNRPTSQRLYRLIDHERAGKPVYRGDLFDLQERIPLSDKYKLPSKIRNVLKPAHEELVAQRFLARIEYEGKSGVVYHIAPEFDRRQKARAISGSAEEFFVINRLVAEGVHGEVARELVAEHGAEHCGFYLDVLPHQKDIGNPGGWLRKYISKGWRPQIMPAEEPEEGFPSGDSGGEPGEGGGGTGRTVSPPPVPAPEAQRLWEKVLENLSDEIDLPTLRVWFEGTVPTHLQDHTLTLTVPNAVARGYIESRFKPLLEEALVVSLASKDASLIFEVAGEPPLKQSPSGTSTREDQA